MKANVMVYEKTGNVKSKRNVVEQSIFKDMKTANIVFGALRELYKRFSTELWAVACIATWGVIVYSKFN